MLDCTHHLVASSEMLLRVFQIFHMLHASLELQHQCGLSKKSVVACDFLKGIHIEPIYQNCQNNIENMLQKLQKNYKVIHHPILVSLNNVQIDAHKYSNIFKQFLSKSNILAI